MPSEKEWQERAWKTMQQEKISPVVHHPVKIGKKFLGIESEGVGIGTPFIQFSAFGCSNYCSSCLDPEHKKQKDPLVVYRSSKEAHDGILSSFRTKRKVNHITLDIGCAEGGFSSFDYDAWASIADSLSGYDVWVETRAKTLFWWRSYRRMFRLHVSIDMSDPHSVFDQAHEIADDLTKFDMIKFILWTREDWAKVEEELFRRQAGGLPEFQGWLSIIPSPTVDKELMEELMSLFETSAVPNARFICPQHFLLDRWDR